MNDRLPPLTALRAFGAASRHLSFAKAAEELHVTPAALSFQIKSLEAHLGQPVFQRLNRAVELTEAGRTLAPGVQDGFDTLARAWRNTRRLSDARVLTITAGPAFTAKWFAPRLFDFASRHPEIDLRFSASLRFLDFDRDDIDIAIRYGIGRDDGLFSIRILDDWLTPMMAPDLAAQYPDPTALREATLLEDRSIDFLTPPCDWAAWFRANGLAAPRRLGPRFNQADHALDAAASGAGVVLGRAAIAQRDIAEGRLVTPYAVALSTEAHFRFVCRDGHETRPGFATFLAWMHAQAEALDALRVGRTFVSAAEVAP